MARPRNQPKGETASTSYRKHLFVGIGADYQSAVRDAFNQAKAKGFTQMRQIDHRSVPKDADLSATDWRDTDWRDTDWRDTNFVRTHNQAVVMYGFK